jgi:hypothetical protein
MPKQPKRYFVAKESMSGVIDGAPFVANPSDLPLAEDDPRVKAYPQHFVEYETPDVEQATAAPGERRNR